MKILITNHHLVNFGGTEVFTLELAKGLKRTGHEVTVYSKFIDKLASFFDRDDIPVVTDLSFVKNQKFDIAHVHHNISALEVRHAFPKLPIFYLSHGSIEFLERPPELDVNIAYYGAVSQHIAKKMAHSGIQKNKIALFYNIVDENRFKSVRSTNKTPKKALILSAKIDEKKEKVIKSACKKLGIKVTSVGGRFGEVAYYGIPTYIKNTDIVFTIGRGVVETMMCGRIPIVFDIHGGDGMVTPDNFIKLLTRSFTGKLHSKNYTVTQLVKEIKNYQPEFGKKLQILAQEYFSLKTQIPKIENLYKKTILLHNSKAKIDNQSLQIFINTIKTSVYYQSRMKANRSERSYLQYKLKFDEIASSKFFKLWPFYIKLKDLLR